MAQLFPKAEPTGAQEIWSASHHTFAEFFRVTWNILNVGLELIIVAYLHHYNYIDIIIYSAIESNVKGLWTCCLFYWWEEIKRMRFLTITITTICRNVNWVTMVWHFLKVVSQKKTFWKPECSNRLHIWDPFTRFPSKYESIWNIRKRQFSFNSSS